MHAMKKSKKRSLLYVVIVAAIGGFLFGFDSGVISGCEQAIQVEFGLSAFWHGLIISGALIGTLERWLIVFFMAIQQYEAIGFLVAAKSILRFSETKESEKSEYVLAGTLVSIAIAVACGSLILAIS